MRVEEMRRREPYLEILRKTLERSWSELHSSELRVSLESSPSAQPWFFQSLLGVYCSRWPGKSAREFARDGFRWTSVVRRIAPQFVVGTAISTRLGLRVTTRPEFWVSPPVPHADECLVLPGNQSLRLFDFRAGRVRVVVKEGFDRASMKREISLRTGERGPFGSVLSHAEDGRWFDEEILEGWPLSRCPPWTSRRAVERAAFRLLEEWQTVENVSSAGWAQSLRARLESALDNLDVRYPAFDWQKVRRWADMLLEQASTVSEVLVGSTHGDLQPGNIFVRAGTHAPQLIDWEHWGKRLAVYDELTYALRSRAGVGLAGRLNGFLQGAEGERFTSLPLEGDATYRRSTLGQFLLEELLWFCTEALSGPYLAVPDGLRGYLRELSFFGPRLKQLFG